MKRRGTSLLEITVAIALLAVFISASGALLTTLFRMQRSMSAALQEQTIRARLGVQLRADAHAAASATCDDEQSCELAQAAGKTIRYRVAEKAIHREVRNGDVVEHREEYSLTHSRAAFSVDSSLELPLLQLRVEPVSNPGKYSIPQRPLLLEAAVGATSLGGKEG